MTNPGSSVVILFLITIFVLSYILRIFEAINALVPKSDAHINHEGKYFNCLYLIIITLSTVGYGDLSPDTYPGKFVIIFTALWGAFMISLLLLTVSNVF